MFIQFRQLVAAALGLGLLASAQPVMADGIMEEPLPRFEDRICPGVLGMEREFAELVVTRVRQTAEGLGLQLAREETCEPNLVIGFVDDATAYLAELIDRRGYVFAEMDRADREELLAGEAPFRVWHQIAARTRDGIRVGRRDNMVTPPQAGMWQAHSRIYRPVRHDITYALVLFDSAAVEGLTLRQLADFAALQALATEAPIEQGEPQPSVRSLFAAPDVRPDGLTAFDHAFLARLYRGIPNLPASRRLRALEVAAGD